MFTPSNMLRRYLNAQPRDMYDIVGALMGYIDADPAFRTSDFDEAVKYVLNHGVSEKELYAEFDPGHDFEEDESKWDKKYYSYARVYLTDNFCRKRIDHVKKVAGKVYPAMPSEIHDAPKPMPAQKQTRQPGPARQRQAGQPAPVPQKQTGQPGMTSLQPAQTKGRQTEPGKKSRGQTRRKQTITVPVGVKIVVGLIVIIVGLALVIALIIG